MTNARSCKSASKNRSRTCAGDQLFELLGVEVLLRRRLAQNLPTFGFDFGQILIELHVEICPLDAEPRGERTLLLRRLVCQSIGEALASSLAEFGFLGGQFGAREFVDLAGVV